LVKGFLLLHFLRLAKVLAKTFQDLLDDTCDVVASAQPAIYHHFQPWQKFFFGEVCRDYLQQSNQESKKESLDGL